MMKKFIIGIATSLLALTALTFTAPSVHAATTYQTIVYGLNRPNYTQVRGWSWSVRDTNGFPVGTLAFQTDCNLVDYKYTGSGNPIARWASGTVRPIGTVCTFVIQNDGNLVIYQSGHGAIWASGTNRGPTYEYNLDIDSNAQLVDWRYRASDHYWEILRIFAGP